MGANLMGTEFQSEDERKFWRWLVMVAPWCECASLPLNCILNMGQVANFMLCGFCHNKKKNTSMEEPAKQIFLWGQIAERKEKKGDPVTVLSLTHQWRTVERGQGYGIIGILPTQEATQCWRRSISPVQSVSPVLLLCRTSQFPLFCSYVELHIFFCMAPR